MKRLLLWLLLIAPLAAAQPPFAERARSAIEFYAHRPNGGYEGIAARLYLHQDPAWCSRRLQELLAAGPSGDMFWMFPVTAIAYLDRGQLTPAARRALRRAWKTYMPYRGDTENHWVMYYASLYLMAQLWPHEPGTEWYTGKSSEENLREARHWIESWVTLTTTRGQGEYDSPHYMAMYLIPVSFLAAWAEEPAMKKRASMMLEYLLADYAAECLDGLYVGAHSRVYERQLVEKWANVSSDFGWVLFGVGRPLEPVSAYMMYYLVGAGAGAEPPEILRHIASDRSRPYTHYERKRTRNRWRFYDELHGPVYKTTYVRHEYAVGSDQGGVLQPIQQHSWDVTWWLPDPRGVQNTFFTIQPYSSLRELQTYFTFGPDAGVEGVVQSKPTYDSPDKLLGGSPYEKILQDQDTLIALYDIPPGTRFPQVNGFFSKDLAEVREDPSGWIFLRGGEALIACRPLEPYSWKPIVQGGRRLFSPYLRNGVVVQVAAASEFTGMDAFRRAILALPLEFRLDPVPTVRFRSLRGRQLAFTWGQTPTVDGRPLDYAHWPLFGGPFLESAVDSGRLVLKYGRQRRVLDFPSLTVRDEQAP
ncbi:MAG TPA: hypothetical protein VFA33_03650 [Bryobacteraceae bacterium]|nr:hypothetical protein [Bryobacteraceae bacterium]